MLVSGSGVPLPNVHTQQDHTPFVSIDRFAGIMRAHLLILMAFRICFPERRRRRRRAFIQSEDEAVYDACAEFNSGVLSGTALR